MPMSQEEWLEAQLAAAPPLTPTQLAVLRAIWRPAPGTSAAPACPQEPQPDTERKTA